MRARMASQRRHRCIRGMPSALRLVARGAVSAARGVLDVGNSMARPLAVILGALAGVLIAAGCGASTEDAAQSESRYEETENSEAAELDKVLGNDRVGRVFRANLGAVSWHLGDFERA